MVNKVILAGAITVASIASALGCDKVLTSTVMVPQSIVMAPSVATVQVPQTVMVPQTVTQTVMVPQTVMSTMQVATAPAVFAAPVAVCAQKPRLLDRLFGRNKSRSRTVTTSSFSSGVY